MNNMKVENTRVLSKREQYLNAFFKPTRFTDDTGLEIGPYDKPYLPRTEYPNVKYADVFSTEELIERAIKNPRRDKDKVESVDYIIAEKTISQAIPQSSMQYVFCSHVLEHVPNLIETLQHIESILKPGGYLLCAYPDRRYTFDIARSATTIEELQGRFDNKQQMPDPDTVYDYFVNYRNVFVGKLWQNMEDPVSDPVYTEEYAKLMANLSKDSYVDVHCNIFSDTEFSEIIEQLVDRNFLNLKIIELQQTKAPRNEFLTILQRV